LFRKPEGNRPFGKLGDERTILRWNFKTWDGRISIRIIPLRIRNSDELL
jgi:hypothetical protein